MAGSPARHAGRTAGATPPSRSLSLSFALLLTAYPAPLPAQEASTLIGRTVTAVVIEQEGRTITDAAYLDLLETEAGRPLSMADVRETIEHFDGLGLFDDVQAVAEEAGAGVRLRYRLVPAHPVESVVFEGNLGLPEAEVRDAVLERHGATPPASRAPEVLDTLAAFYRDHGYLDPSLRFHVEERHDPDAATLTFTIDAGRHAMVADVRVEGVPAAEQDALLGRLSLRPGRPFDNRELREALDGYEADLRAGGFYEARADASAEYGPDGDARVTVAVERGPRVEVAFEGDPIDGNLRESLVPIERERSVDEDLLENAALAIEDYWKARGYRDATVRHRREERAAGLLVVTFTIARGSRHLVAEARISGHAALATEALRAGLDVVEGAPFVQMELESSADFIRQVYRERGFTDVNVLPRVEVLEDGSAGADRRVLVAFDVSEGPRTVVSRVELTGHASVPEGEIRPLLETVPGAPYSDAAVRDDRDRIETLYLNRGYQTVVVRPSSTRTEDREGAVVRFAIQEGPLIVVDHVIVLGNRRISTETIRREVSLEPGQPLGFDDLIESQQRLSALGLFRRATIRQRQHGADPRRDVIVEVEEAPPITIGYGGGVEAGRRLRPTAERGEAEERFELAPRAFFEITRRNLWGKNRSVTLFTRASLRSRDIAVSPGDPAAGTYGFNEYRVVGTYREPRALGTRADVIVVGTLDQSIRSSFNFKTREVNARTATALSPRYTATGTYAYRAVELFDERFTEEEKPVIDRLFPQVNLSMLAATIVRDTRNDLLDPDTGLFLALEQTFAARAYGSEVGFVKTYAQALGFARLPSTRRIVVAVAARLGLAHGFPRVVGGERVVNQLPASERFFAGGDTTVRGFALDRLGDAGTISPTGFPTGGNGLVVLNAELRSAASDTLQAVVFLDAGNVFPAAGDLSLADLRPAAGVGLRYVSPVGPIRVDWGFNLDRRELTPGRLERSNVLHISLGQAF